MDRVLEKIRVLVGYRVPAGHCLGRREAQAQRRLRSESKDFSHHQIYIHIDSISVYLLASLLASSAESLTGSLGSEKVPALKSIEIEAHWSRIPIITSPHRTGTSGWPGTKCFSTKCFSMSVISTIGTAPNLEFHIAAPSQLCLLKGTQGMC